MTERRVTKKVTKDVTKKVKEENRRTFANKLIHLMELGKITISDAASALDMSEEEFKVYMG